MSDTPDVGAVVAQLLDPARRVTVLAAAAAKAESEYRQAPTKANLDAWQAALRELKAGAAPEAPAPAPEAERAYTAKEALEYLRAQGWKCGKSKLYDDTAAGVIGRGKDGRYTRRALDDYGPRCGPLTGESREEGDRRLAREKQEHEVRKLAAEADRRQLQLGRERGELISRADAERALAARALLLRGDVEGWAHEVPLTIVDRFGLAAEALPELRSLLLAAAKEWLGRYAEDKEFAQMLPAGGEP